MSKDSLSEPAALRGLLSETPDIPLLTAMLGFVADRRMALDVDQLCGAGAQERSDDPVIHRNAYRSRAWKTRAGRVDVKIAKRRKGSCFPEFLKPRRAAQTAMTVVIQKAQVQRLSTRSVDDLVKAMGMTGASKSQISRLCGEIDERVDAFPGRPLEGGMALPRMTIRRCRVHLMRNALACVGKKDRPIAAAAPGTAFDQDRSQRRKTTGPSRSTPSNRAIPGLRT